MKSSRAWLKYAIRFLKNHESQLKKDSLTKKLSQSKSEEFSEEIRQINNCNIFLPNSVEAITGKDNITELWNSHFEQLFNCIRYTDFLKMKYDGSHTNDIVVEMLKKLLNI